MAGATLILVLAALLAVLAPWIAPASLGAGVLEERLLPPSGAHLMGTDDLGRDVLSQTLHGLRTSLFIAVTATLVCGVVGTVLGALAGWFGGKVDVVVSFLVGVQASIPAFVLALGALVFFGGSPLALVIVLSIEGWDRFARIVRVQTMSIRRSGYVGSALSLGVASHGVLLRHVLPGIVGVLAVQATLALPVKVVIESALSFLGLGIRPPETSLGQMVGAGRDYLTNAPWIALFPGLVIIVVSVAASLLGDRLQDRMVDRD